MTAHHVKLDIIVQQVQEHRLSVHKDPTVMLHKLLAKFVLPATFALKQLQSQFTVLQVNTLIRGPLSVLPAHKASVARSTMKILNNVLAALTVHQVRTIAQCVREDITVLQGQHPQRFVKVALIVTRDRVKSSSVPKVTSVLKAHIIPSSAMRGHTLPQVQVFASYALQVHIAMLALQCQSRVTLACIVLQELTDVKYALLVTNALMHQLHPRFALLAAILLYRQLYVFNARKDHIVLKDLLNRLSVQEERILGQEWVSVQLVMKEISVLKDQ